ncbi:hypothetical protein [Comamonas jiangduensis]|uniref:hypothetical protein n=1 Tax=Comamonas jiangduensis TaxID=1194168 RepID=UPI00352679F4
MRTTAVHKKTAAHAAFVLHFLGACRVRQGFSSAALQEPTQIGMPLLFGISSCKSHITHSGLSTLHAALWNAAPSQSLQKEELEALDMQ